MTIELKTIALYLLSVVNFVLLVQTIVHILMKVRPWFHNEKTNVFASVIARAHAQDARPGIWFLLLTVFLILLGIVNGNITL